MKTTAEAIVATAFHTAAAADRCAAADAQFAAEFCALTGEARAARWRGLTTAEKSRLIVRRIEALNKDWMPSIVAEFIARYDEQFAAGPVDAAVEGALERLAIDNSQYAATADKADRRHFRATATAYTNALIEYRKGVRPELLASGAWLLPSRRAGEAPHIVSMHGDWVCSCKAGANMHWPIALVIGCEVAQDDMQAWDDGDVACDPPAPEPNPLGDEEGDSEPPDRPRQLVAGYGAFRLSCGLPNPLYRIQEHERLLGERIAAARRNAAYAA